jgi:flagellar basal body-associated protein FliL
MVKNVIITGLIILMIITLVFAWMYRNEAMAANIANEQLREASEQLSRNSQMERDRQYQLSLRLKAENDELKERLKDCD